jgi:Acetyltransferase (GNAT) domain
MNKTMTDRLLCKPATDADPAQLLYSVYFPSVQALVSLRSLNLNKGYSDLDMIHSWVNQPYAKRFWQMDGSCEVLLGNYKRLLAHPMAHSYVGLINGKPACMIDAYSAAGDELKDHIDTRDHDTGLHLLMAPPRELKKGWSLAALQAFQDFYFSFPVAERLFGEPDRDNHAANQLSRRAGFEFLKCIQMSYKIANLYCLTRSHFQILRTSSQTQNII